MNFMTMIQRGWFLTRCLMMMAMTATAPAWAAEYEVDGKLSQTIFRVNSSNLHASASFTVFVRDCGWLIQTTETNERGNVLLREIGSTNAGVICECYHGAQAAQAPAPGGPPPQTVATIIPGDIPVGQLDIAVTGHLWLMFASQCYWTHLKSDRLTPVYDWHASVAAHGDKQTVEAQWDLLSGPGSLPREVRYLGQWEETNGLYRVTGSNSVAGMLIPTGFFFEARTVGPLLENSLIHGMTVRKRVDVEVTAVRPVCSRASLLPSPPAGTFIIDRRMPDLAAPSSVPSYRIAKAGQWPSIEEATQMVGAVRNANALPPPRAPVQTPPPDIR